MLRISWWKWLSVALLCYTLIMGFLGPVPALDILNESIRNLYFHVPMWFGMVLLFCLSVIYSIMFLVNGNEKNDFRAAAFIQIGTLYGILGLLTGMIWARFTWGDWWNWDPKQNGAAISLLIYFAYFVLRNALPDQRSRGVVSSVYNIFAFTAIIPLIFILPRMTQSLHPGAGGNPGFNTYDLDSNMRLVFYPAVIGWFLLGLWMSQLRYRMKNLEELFYEKINK